MCNVCAADGARTKRAFVFTGYFYIIDGFLHEKSKFKLIELAGVFE